MWLVQAMGIDTTNADTVMAVLKTKGIPFVPVGVVPFSNEITGLEGVDLEPGKVMVYGSTKLVRLTKELGLTPGPSFDYLNFSVPVWSHFLPDLMLNAANMVQIRTLLNGHPINLCDKFIRPAMDLKAFPGTVIKRGENWREFFEKKFYTEDFDQNLLVSFAGTRDIDTEWRFFVVNRKVVSASQYRKNGQLSASSDVNEHAAHFAQWVCDNRWLPHDNCVIDVAAYGELFAPVYKIVEFNCINCSGLYAANVENLVDALNSLML